MQYVMFTANNAVEWVTRHQLCIEITVVIGQSTLVGRRTFVDRSTLTEKPSIIGPPIFAEDKCVIENHTTHNTYLFV